ncbi:cobalt ECF transporter T component CbiQ [Methanosphaera cuniculi]|uniref:cobalt ECF transporter T component CbiQ n=1 Tax=Methanosphaera cuniculi TaxID=1077256 RepID=UPI0026F35FDC|nr:cobalt ECF transporter T component CbiQ [Methanosphaera cuniculi]
MVTLNELMTQDALSSQDNLLHDIDSRIKLIVLILTIVFTVSTTNYMVFAILEAYLIILIYLSNISIKDALLRVLLILPFGFFIAIFQPFIHPGDVICTLPFGLTITQQGLEFGELLMIRLAVCITAIVLFSYITPMQAVAEAFRKLHLPKEFGMIFSLFVRFLFLFFDEFETIRQSQKSRGFGLSNKAPYKWKLKQFGGLFLMMFLRAYERGETVYNTMACRGYSADSQIYTANEKITKKSYIYLLITILVILICVLIEFLPNIM